MTRNDMIRLQSFDSLIVGDICSVTVLGQHLVFLNSAQLCKEKLDKKSAIYLDRPVLQMGEELGG